SHARRGRRSAPPRSSRVAPRRSRERQRERPRDRSPRTPQDLLDRAVDIDRLATDGHLIMAADQHVTDRAGRQGHHVAALGGGELQDHVPPIAFDVHVTGAGAAVDVTVGEQLAADRPGHGLAAGNEGYEHYEWVVWVPGELAPAA